MNYHEGCFVQGFLFAFISRMFSFLHWDRVSKLAMINQLPGAK